MATCEVHHMWDGAYFSQIITMKRTCRWIHLFLTCKNICQLWITPPSQVGPLWPHTNITLGTCLAEFGVASTASSHPPLATPLGHQPLWSIARSTLETSHNTTSVQIWMSHQPLHNTQPALTTRLGYITPKSVMRGSTWRRATNNTNRNRLIQTESVVNLGSQTRNDVDHLVQREVVFLKAKNHKKTRALNAFEWISPRFSAFFFPFFALIFWEGVLPAVKHQLSIIWVRTRSDWNQASPKLPILWSRSCSLLWV